MSSFAKFSAAAAAWRLPFPCRHIRQSRQRQVGMLTCEMSPGISAVIGSIRDLNCEFKPTGSGPWNIIRASSPSSASISAMSMAANSPGPFMHRAA